MALMFVKFLVHLTSGGETRINNVFLNVMHHGRLSLKTVSRSARSLANPVNGGETKIRLVNQIVMLLGSKVATTMFLHV